LHWFPGFNRRRINAPHGEDAMTKAMCRAGAVLLGAALLGATVSARAEMVKLQAELKGSNEVPPNASTASGTAEATLDTDTKFLTYTITYSGLTGPAMGAHFHGPSEAGKNAGIVLPFKSVQSPIQGTATLTDTQAADLLAGKWYANIHTGANPGGELRGQMTKQ
jgi:CHRD domain-containing protein